MRTLALITALIAAPELARADGVPRCSNPDHDGSCTTTGADHASVGCSLLLLGAVTYGLARRKRRRSPDR